MKNLTGKVIVGVALVVVAVLLASQPVYTSVKGAVVDAGGSIGLAVAISWILIAVALVSGITLLRRA